MSVGGTVKSIAPHIDDQLDCQLHGQIGGLGAFQNANDIARCTLE